MESDGRARWPQVMGILNVTPDSFFDGGRYIDPKAAVERGHQMVAEGADVVDVGGESSRPGAEPVGAHEELGRVLPVVEALAGHVAVSVDTVKAEVARAAVKAGAELVNDISGELWPVAAELGAGWVAVHMKGTPRDMQRDPRYSDVVAEVREFLVAKVTAAVAAGVPAVWADPGIGFGKTVAHNLALLAHLGEIKEATQAAGACGVLVGTSRKTFLGVLGAAGGPPLPAGERLEASLASAVWSLSRGASMVRVHDVAVTCQAARLLEPVPVGGGKP